jgi:hypothetical protein
MSPSPDADPDRPGSPEASDYIWALYQNLLAAGYPPAEAENLAVRLAIRAIMDPATNEAIVFGPWGNEMARVPAHCVTEARGW